MVAEKSPIEKATEGGAEHIARQQKEYADQQKAEAERVAALTPTYPRIFDEHTKMKDRTNDREFVGTQYSFNTMEEALGKISQARAHAKYVMYADPDNNSYVIRQSDDDYRVNIED